MTVNGTVKVVADGGFQLNDRNGDVLTFVDERMDVGQDVPLFNDRFVGSPLGGVQQQVDAVASHHDDDGGHWRTDAQRGRHHYHQHLRHASSTPKFRGYVDGALYDAGTAVDP